MPRPTASLPRVAAHHRDQVFLVEVGDGRARVVDLRARYVGPAMNAIAIASRGGWDVFDGDEEREREILAAMSEITPAEPRHSPARVPVPPVPERCPRCGGHELLVSMRDGPEDAGPEAWGSWLVCPSCGHEQPLDGPTA